MYRLKNYCIYYHTTTENISYVANILWEYKKGSLYGSGLSFFKQIYIRVSCYGQDLVEFQNKNFDEKLNPRGVPSGSPSLGATLSSTKSYKKSD